MKIRRSKIVFFITLFLAAADAGFSGVFPQAAWQTRYPEEVGLDPTALRELSEFMQGRGCVVRHGFLVYTWGDCTAPGDVASAVKPWISHFLFKAVEQGRLPSLDEEVRKYAPCLEDLNPALEHKDRRITFRHMANQTSCYGVSEAPGAAFDYNDFQMALFFDTLFLKVYSVSYEIIDDTVLKPLLTGPLQCEDHPSFLAFGPGDRAGRLSISPRDFARFGLLYLHEGNWRDQSLLSPAFAHTAVTNPLPATLPRTAAREAEMCPGQRTLGSQRIPDNQADHRGSYSWLWWINGLDVQGHRPWPDAPADVFAALGHQNGMRGMAVFPSLDIVMSWNDTALGDMPEQPDPLNTAFGLLCKAAGRRPAPDFTLGDQYNQIYNLRFPSGRVHLLMIADRHTSGQVLKWYNPIAARYRGPEAVESSDGERYLAGNQGSAAESTTAPDMETPDRDLIALAKDGLSIEGVAAINDIPIFWKPWVKWFFRRFAKKTVMLDWDDSVSQRFGFVPRCMNVFVVAPDGAIVLKLKGKASPDQFEVLFDTVDRLLRANAQTVRKTKEPPR